MPVERINQGDSGLNLDHFLDTTLKSCENPSDLHNGDVGTCYLLPNEFNVLADIGGCVFYLSR